jgi:hypothetical protein
MADVRAPAADAAAQQCHYDLHKSLAYGCDWCPRPASWADVVSCSFYDKQLHLWRFDPAAEAADSGAKPQD